MPNQPSQPAPFASRHQSVGRRAFLRSSAVLALGGVAAACTPRNNADDNTTPSTTGSTPPGTTVDPNDPAVQAAQAVGIDPSTFSWSILLPESLYVTKPDGRLQFAIFASDRTILAGRRDIEVAVVRSDDNTPVVELGPAPFVGEELGDRGVYLITPTLEPGLYEIVVTDAARENAGVATLNVTTAEAVPWPAYGEPMVRFESPTFANPTPGVPLCTQDPPCGMHEDSVADLLDAGRPFFLLMATPLYCATAICGPVVSIVDEFRAKIAPDLPDDFAFVHHEIFSDEGQTYLPVVTQTLQIPFEPYGFVIDADGTVMDTHGGTIIPDLLEPSLRQVN